MPMTTIAAFTPDHICRLTGLTKRQLGYWDRTGFFPPRYADENRRRPFSRVYNFRDLVGLRTLALLRNKYNIPLQQLRRAGEWLSKHYTSPWSSLKFWVGGGKVFFTDPDSGERVATRPQGQEVFPFEMVEVEREMEMAAERLKERLPEEIGKITRSRDVLHNVARIAGTRIPTSAIWNFYEDGYDTAGILSAYPRLTERDIDAAIAYEQAHRQRRAG
jgi:uncharacterized protein (DUF433 family)